MTSENNTIVIFDTPDRDGKIWSHHVLRILYAVHYKEIPYSIKGLEYPDINSTFAPTPLEPKVDPIEPYEIPVLKFQTPTGNPRYHMNPAKIIEELEKVKPDPPLLYDTPRSVEYRHQFGPAFVPILQLAIGHVPGILSEHSSEAFVQKREKRWGKSVQQWIAEHPISEELAKAEPRVKEFGDWLELTPGPFVNGNQPGYADFTVASFLGFIRALGLTHVFQSVLEMHPAIQRLYDGVKWTQKGNTRCHDLFETFK